MPNSEHILCALYVAGHTRDMDAAYINLQVHLLELEGPRLHTLWGIAEGHAENVLALLEAFEVGMVDRQQVEEVLAGAFSLDRVRLLADTHRQARQSAAMRDMVSLN